MYLSEFDIGNRALQHIGETKMTSPTEDSRKNDEVSAVYDNMRLWELRRNVWRFSIRRAILRAVDGDTMLLAPNLWENTTSYPPGAIVRDENGVLWQSLVAGNTNNDPMSTVAWDRYFGPMTVHKYDSEKTYYSGELVWAEAGNPGGYVIYRSLTEDNEDDPETGTAWDEEVTYNAGETVSYGGYHWRSLIEVNRDITPAVGPLAWDEGSTYAAAETVTGSDGFIYSSIAGSNQGFDPVDDGGVHWTNTGVAHAWKRVPAIWASSVKWQPLFAGVENLLIAYPLNTGPGANGSRAVFRLPAGFIRLAVSNPKVGSQAFLGASSSAWYDDNVIEGDFVTAMCTNDVLVMRFAADVSDVRVFDTMFCEGLACRIGLEICEALTQSTAKQSTIAGKYQKFMTEARLVNAIEVGSEEPAEDLYLSVRR